MKIRDTHMRLASKVFLGLFFILSFIFVLISPDTARAGTHELCENCSLSLQPTNYCQSCHSAGDERLMNATAWTGGIDRAASSPCPAEKTINEELYYTERLLLAIDRGKTQLPAYVDTASMDARLSSAQQTYSRLLDTPVTSLDAFVSEAQVLRFRLGKIYSQINQLIEQGKQLRILIFAGIATLLLLVSLAWGWMNAHKASLSVGISKGPFYLKPKFWILILLVFIFFSLPIFRGASQEITAASVEQQEQQAVLDSALRSSDTADRELARSWMMAQAAAASYALDPDQAVQKLDAALLAATEAQRNSYVIWGEAKSAQEAAIGEWAAEDKALYITSQLDAMRSRAWGLQEIAETWMTIDSEKAAGILEQALVVAQDTVGDYSDLDIRSIAVSYAHLDPVRSLEILNTVNSLPVKAWGLREIAAITGDPSIMDLAAKTARQIDDPVLQANALRKLAVLSGDVLFFEDAKQALVTVDERDAVLAFAWADLIASSGDLTQLSQIDPQFPSAKVFALLATGQFDQAWSEAENISDLFERARAQVEISSQWGNAEHAQLIKIPIFRDLALRNVSIKQRDLSLAKKIENVYYRTQALTDLGDFSGALALSTELSDKYPLVQLVKGVAEDDIQAALPLVDLMDREADKAQALRSLAALSKDRKIFDRALSMAEAARVRGDSLAPSSASLFLGMDLEDANPDWANLAFTQAYDIAWRMIIKYE